MRVRGIALALSGLSLVVVVALAASGLWPAAAAGSATVQITPPSSYVETGSTVDVSIDVQGLTTGLGVYEFRLLYDTTRLEKVAVANTGFLGSTGRAVSCGEQSEPGAVVYRCNTNTLTPPGPTGNGSMAQIRFRGLSEGDAPLHFAKLELGVEEGEGIEISDYGEAVIRIGDEPAPAATPGGGGGSSSDAATPTKVPRALTPTIPAGVVATPTLPAASGEEDFTTYDPADAGQRPSAGPVGILGDSGGAPTGSVNAAAAAAGSNFPVAGTGPQDGDERFSASALMGLVLAGGLLIFLGGFIARKTQEA